MRSGNFLPSLAVFGTCALWLVAAATSGRFSMTAMLLIVLGVQLLVATTIGGMLFTKSLWAQRLGLGLVALCLLPAAVLERGLWWWLGVSLMVLTTYVLASPTTEVRIGLAASAPPTSATVLMLALLSVPLVVGIINAFEEPASLIGFSVALPVLAWWFGRAAIPALWLARTAAPLAVGALASLGPWPHAGWLVALAIVIAVAAWRPETQISVIPLVPERHRPKPIFAEMAPPEVLNEAGLDERGRRA